MRTPVAVALVLALLLPASAFAAKKKAAAAATKPAAKTAKPGKADRAALEAAKALARPFQPWDDSFKKVTDAIGQPAKTEGAKYFWYAKDGDKCTELEIDKMGGDSVGATSIADYDATMKDKFAKCSAAK